MEEILILGQDFLTLLIGILVEAFPFIVFGSLVASFVEFFLKEDFLLKRMPKNIFLSHLFISVLGFALPICECGNVPVVRKFLGKGLNVSHALTFLLSAPILNPITIWTTYIAFPNDPEIVIFRVLGALIIANIFGYILIGFRKEDLLTDKFVNEYCNHRHSKKLSLKNFSLSFSSEFLDVFKMLVWGAILASAIRTLVPTSVIQNLSVNPILSILTLMLMGFVISVCANIDAFFARAYSGLFPNGSIVAFLVFGPMIDIKMMTMLRTTFKTNFLVFLSFYLIVSNLLLGLVVNTFL